jgi:hypothetical protein
MAYKDAAILSFELPFGNFLDRCEENQEEPIDILWPGRDSNLVLPSVNDHTAMFGKRSDQNTRHRHC